MSGLDWYHTHGFVTSWDSAHCDDYINNRWCYYTPRDGVNQIILDQGNMYWHALYANGQEVSWMRYTSEGYIYQSGAYNAGTGLYELITFTPSAGNPTRYTITSYTADTGLGNYSGKVGTVGSGTVTKDASGNFVLSNGTVIPALNSSNFTMQYPNDYGN